MYIAVETSSLAASLSKKKLSVKHCRCCEGSQRTFRHSRFRKFMYILASRKRVTFARHCLFEIYFFVHVFKVLNSLIFSTNMPNPSVFILQCTLKNPNCSLQHMIFMCLMKSSEQNTFGAVFPWLQLSSPPTTLVRLFLDGFWLHREQNLLQIFYWILFQDFD